MLKLLKHLKWQEWLLLLLTFCILGVHAYCNLLLPEFMGDIIRFLGKGSELGAYWQDILWTCLKMLATIFGIIACVISVGALSAHLTTSLMARVRGNLFRNVNNFSMAEINKFSIASLVTRSTNDITQLQNVYSMILGFGITAPVTAIIAIIKVVNISKQLSVINIVSIILLLLVVTFIFALVIPKFKVMQKNTDKINLLTRENLTGLRVVRAYSAEKVQEDKFEVTNKFTTKIDIFINKVFSLIDPAITLIMQGTSLAIVWLVAYLSGGNPEYIAIIGEFTQYSAQIIMGFMMLSMLFMMIPRGIVSARRINDVLDEKSSIIEGSVASDENLESNKKSRKGTVVFENVSFKYPDADEYVLENISFEAKPGQTVAFIGSTGSGKSTLINLIPRFYDATVGKVLVDGIDVKDYKLSYLHDKLGYVPQRGVLFSGSVDENIKYGAPNASKREVLKAIETSKSGFIYKLDKSFKGITAKSDKKITEKQKKKISAMDALIKDESPIKIKGLEHFISQGGKNVSGGQKQRLSIARAIVKNPEIFIFDDSFSALDYKTDKSLRRKLKKYMGNATCLIVAQRIGTIINADQIIVLDEGKIVGRGKHKELLKTCEVYKEIALTQLSEEELKK